MPIRNEQKYQAALQQMQEAITAFLKDVIIEEFTMADVVMTGDMMKSKTPPPYIRKIMDGLKETKDISHGVLLCVFVAVMRAELTILSDNQSNWKKK